MVSAFFMAPSGKVPSHTDTEILTSPWRAPESERANAHFTVALSTLAARPVADGWVYSLPSVDRLQNAKGGAQTPAHPSLGR